MIATVFSNCMPASPALPERVTSRSMVGLILPLTIDDRRKKRFWVLGLVSAHTQHPAPDTQICAESALVDQVFCLSPLTNRGTAEPPLTGSAVVRFNRMAMS